MKIGPIGCAVLLSGVIAGSASAIQIDSLQREVMYSGGLELPDQMGDSLVSQATGTFNQSFDDSLSDPGVAASGASVSQISYVDVYAGSLVVDVSTSAFNYTDEYAATAVSGAIAESIAWSSIDVVFTTTAYMRFTVDMVVSSSLGVFYDGPGEGAVDTTHIGSLQLCVVGDGCAVDLFDEDLTDNGMAVTDGLQGIGLFPPGRCSIALIAFSQTISRDVGSSSGGASFSGTITVEPLPEPSVFTGLTAGVLLLVVLAGRA